MNTVELAYHYLAYVGQCPIPRVQPCDQPAPDEPNSWTDGSYKNPGKRLAVGSFGVWHPNRDAADLRPEECDFVTPIPQSIHGQPGGLMLAGILPGVFNSSTRTELAAFIAICSSPHAIHVGIDNEKVVRRTNAILQGNHSTKRDWDLLPDGDLWRIAESCIRIRRPHATRSSWHRGHASWDQLLKGEVQPWHAINNGIADLAADHGIACQGWSKAQQAFDFLAKRQEAYAALYSRIVKMFSNLLRADGDRRIDQAADSGGIKGNIERIPMPRHQARPALHEGIALVFLDIAPDVAAANDELFTFWRASRWLPCGTSDQRPTTWLEAYAFFRYCGGEGPLNVNPLIPVKSFRNRYHCFMQESKRFLRANLDASSAPFVNGYKERTLLLKHYGINSGLPALSASLCTTEELSSCLHTMLLTFNQSDDPERLYNRRLKWPKADPWFHLIPKNPGLPRILLRHREHLEQSIDIRGAKGGTRYAQPASFELFCPHCKILKNCCRIKLYTTRVRSIHCGECNLTSVASKWHCICEKPWLQCKMHRQQGFACGQANISGMRFATANKAQHHHKQFLARRNAQNRLGCLGEGDFRISAGCITSSRNCLNSAKNKRDKKQKSGVGYIIPTRRDITAGQSHPPDLKTLDPCETSMRYQQHFRQALMPSSMLRDLLPAFSSSFCHSCDDLKGLKRPFVTIGPKEDGSPDSSCSRQAVPRPVQNDFPAKRARHFVSPAAKNTLIRCKGLCPKSGWTIEQFCSHCHG